MQNYFHETHPTFIPPYDFLFVDPLRIPDNYKNNCVTIFPVDNIKRFVDGEGHVIVIRGVWVKCSEEVQAEILDPRGITACKIDIVNDETSRVVKDYFKNKYVNGDYYDMIPFFDKNISHVGPLIPTIQLCDVKGDEIRNPNNRNQVAALRRQFYSSRVIQNTFLHEYREYRRSLRKRKN